MNHSTCILCSDADLHGGPDPTDFLGKMRPMQALRGTALCGVSCLIAFAVTLAAAQPPPSDAELEPLLTKATWYALDFVDKLSSVVSEERYIQDSNVFLAAIA